jgi:hypothetical protein
MKKKNPLIAKIRASKEYVWWKDAVLREQVSTYPTLPDKIQVHHLVSLETIIGREHITTMEGALESKFLWNVSNGIAIMPGEHLILTWLSRKKKTSVGFLSAINFWLEKSNLYEWSRGK